jgi:hypothetical protein
MTVPAPSACIRSGSYAEDAPHSSESDVVVDGG